jgi:hypothetical protein
VSALPSFDRDASEAVQRRACEAAPQRRDPSLGADSSSPQRHQGGARSPLW